MFTVYHSNQLDILKVLIAELIKRKPLSNPFDKEVILVQSQGMAQWLNIELAQQLNIAANIDFPQPAHFIWQLFTQLVPDLPKESAFSKQAMTWKLMQLLPDVINKPQFSALSHYLSAGNSHKKYYQFAATTADLYDQYLVYRPEWINTWQNNKLIEGLNEHQLWQAPLWQELVALTENLHQSPWHRANLYQRVYDRLCADKAIPSLPKRIFICGIVSLPIMYLHLLQALSQHIDVHIMLTNPCRWYWGEIKDQAKQRQHKPSKHHNTTLLTTYSPASQHRLTQSNPLLSSWGKLGRDFIYLLQDIDQKNDIDAFVDAEDTTLLKQLQQDILELRDRAVIGENEQTYNQSHNKKSITQTDDSLHIHVCHSIQREIEILYDQILTMLEADPTLMPRDIIVMVANIDQYVPYIRAVFGNPPKTRYLPFSISDRKINGIDPIIQTFFTLLDLPYSRCTAEDILALLDVPALAQKFQIDELKLAMLRQWVMESGICWGLDETTALEFELPVTGKNTWKFGLTRMLLGYAMNSRSGVWQGYVPYDESSGLIAELAGQLAELVDTITVWRKQLAQAVTLKQWQTLCHQLIDAFFIPQQDNEALFIYIEQRWQKMIELGQNAHFTLPITIDILKEMLQSELEQTHMSQQFLAGQLNFCTLMPMRSIPFKVVCLLGMNDGAYPRTLFPTSFDLIADQPQRGDRSRRDDDRYLFLEALLSAQQKLYISYIGYNMQDNTPRYMSNLVAELLNYTVQSYVLHNDETYNIDESAQRLQHHLTTIHTRVPFDIANFTPNSKQQSYAEEWLPTAQGAKPSQANIFPEEKITTEISLNALIQFYRHSIKSFYQTRLHVYFSSYDKKMTDDEPFTLDPLSRYQLNEQLLNYLIDPPKDPFFMDRLNASGILPFSTFGELYLQQQIKDISPLADQIISEKTACVNQEIDIMLGNIQLVGWLNSIQDNGIFRWRAAELTAVDGIQLWIEHLVCAVLGYNACSKMYGKKNSRWIIHPVEINTARQELIKLIHGYQQGLNQPLLFPIKSAWAWLTTSYTQHDDGQWRFNEQKQHIAEQQIITRWTGNTILYGEGSDNYYQHITKELHQEQLDAIKTTAVEYLLPLLQHKEK